MKNRSMRRTGCLGVLLCYALAIGSLLWALCGCTTTKYVPMETVRAEYVESDTAAIYNRIGHLLESLRESEQRSDSLVDRYKETVVLNERGDTARHDRERITYRSTSREKELERQVAARDSIIRALRLRMASAKTDSVQVPYPVEKPLTRWQQAKMDFGGMAIGVVGAVVVYIIILITNKIIRKT